MNKENLYPNIVSFLQFHGFKVVSIEPKEIKFILESEELSESYKRFRELHKKGDEAASLNESNKIWKESWEIRTEADKKFYPKLQVILDKLNDFYINRSSPLEYRVSFDNNYLKKLHLGENSFYFEMIPDKEYFNSQIKKELDDFDNFLMQ